MFCPGESGLFHPEHDCLPRGVAHDAESEDEESNVQSEFQSLAGCHYRVVVQGCSVVQQWWVDVDERDACQRSNKGHELVQIVGSDPG